MTGFALILILLAAFCHAAWNYVSKKACGGTVFIWLFSAMSSLLYLPFVLWILLFNRPEFQLQHLAFILLSAVLHSVYFILLDKGYRIGDLSVIYPLARGTGPLLSTFTAILFLGEKPTPLALTGVLFIFIGILTITGNPLRASDSNSRKSLAFALLCGMTIAAYTVFDKIAVSMLLLPPIIMDWCTNLGRASLLTPYALKNWSGVCGQWRIHKKEIFIVAILSPLAYILVLTAMVFSPVSYVAPAREISILIGTVMGAKLLSEGNYKTRLTGACSMLVGLTALALG